MKRILIGTTAIAAFLLASGLASAAPGAEAAAVSATPWAKQPVFQVVSPSYSEIGRQEFASGANVTILLADTTRGIDTRATLPNKDQAQFTLTPVDGTPLTTGVYHLVGQESSTPRQPLLEVDGTYLRGELDILDLAANPANGEITRFDAVMEGVGELRFGEDSVGATVLGSRAYAFAETFVGKPKSVMREVVRNTGTSTVTLGKPSISGQSATSFSTSSNTCGATLAGGATCTLVIGFAPKAGGPSAATLSLPVGGVAQTASLAGTGYLGTTSISSGGDDVVDHGVTTTKNAADSAMSVNYSAGGWFFSSSSFVDGHEYIEAEVEGPNGNAPPTGVRRTYAGGEATGNTIRVAVESIGCDTQGTWNVKRFDVDPATKVPTSVDMTFSQTCFGQPTQTGSVQWQARSDVTAPSPVTGLTISSGTPRKANWKASTSADAKAVLARLVEGNGAGATPLSGRPLAVSGGTSATIPSVAAGQQYSVVVFAVDASGNVSRASRASFGTPAVVVSAPSAVTITKIVAGNGQVTLSFQPPANTGGLPITKYEVESDVGSFDATGTSSPITVTGLPNGSANSFLVYAYSAAGRGHVSLLSAPVTPHG